jgi:predicted dehydrogenase
VSSRPRLGFLGVGWIGLARLRALAEAGSADIVALADPEPRARAEASSVAPGAVLVSTYEELLALPLDGVVIATPSGQHSDQAVRALRRNLAVFCQKPLGRSAAEVGEVLRAARRADRPLGVDLCYRHTAALSRLKELVTSGELGSVYAVDTTFHNAYGPSRLWANEREHAGGGCLIDLGVHLLDAARWLLPGSAQAVGSTSALFAGGRPLGRPAREVEDMALAQLLFDDGTTVRVACSWRSSFGADAAIRIACFGTRASAAFENVDGSFFDFRCELYRGTSRASVASPPDAWGARALSAWVRELELGHGYTEDPHLLAVARQIDLIYGEEQAVAAEPRDVLAAAAGA